jgi:hypothetical protein
MLSSSPNYISYYYDILSEKNITLPYTQSVIASFIEDSSSTKEQKKCNALDAALKYCIQNQTHLIVMSFNQALHSKRFTNLLLPFLKKDISVICQDQLQHSKEHLMVLLEHAQQQRSLHGTRIKQGLIKTNARSGNPNAKKIISRINRSKIENAIVFALFLKPIIAVYQQRRYSQRRIVLALNYEGIKAPEGGPWVLSQLQKILERIKMNDATFFIKNKSEYHNDTSVETLSSWLNDAAIPIPRGKTWTPTLIQELQERIHQLNTLTTVNHLLLDMLPSLKSTPVDSIQVQWLRHIWNGRTQHVQHCL